MLQCRNVCLLFQKSGWIDGSPYAFQKWYHPSTETVYPSHEDTVLGDIYLPDRDFPFFHPHKLQPKYPNGDRLCAAVLLRPTLPTRWISIPCQQHITHLWQHKIIYVLLRGQSSGFGILSTKGQPGLRKRSHKQVMPPEYDRLDHYVQCSGRGRYEISRAWL